MDWMRFSFSLFAFLFGVITPFYSSSCSSQHNNDNDEYDCNIDRSYDGSDWQGLYGKFNDTDYEICSDKIIYRYTSGINKAIDLVIPNYVFYKNTKLPVYLSDNLFYGFNISGSIYLNKFMTDIPSHIFENCFNMEKVFLSNKMINVGESSFYGCLSLKTIEFSKYSEYWYLQSEEIFKFIETISDDAFYNVALEIDIFFENLNSIGSAAFNSCNRIKSVNFLNNCLTDQSNLKDECFSNCWNIRYVTLNKNIDTVGKKCFIGCYNLKELKWQINSFEEEIKINEFAFANCRSLERITSDFGFFSPSYIGNNAFDSDINFYINYNFDNFFACTKYIGEYAFSSCKKVVSIKFYLYENLVISSYAFYQCLELTEIDFSNFGSYGPWWETQVCIFNYICNSGTFYVSEQIDAILWIDFFDMQTNIDLDNWIFLSI